MDMADVLEVGDYALPRGNGGANTNRDDDGPCRIIATTTL